MASLNHHLWGVVYRVKDHAGRWIYSKLLPHESRMKNYSPPGQVTYRLLVNYNSYNPKDNDVPSRSTSQHQQLSRNNMKYTYYKYQTFYSNYQKRGSYFLGILIKFYSLVLPWDCFYLGGTKWCHDTSVNHSKFQAATTSWNKFKYSKLRPGRIWERLAISSYFWKKNFNFSKTQS